MNLKPISSRDNPFYKELKHLATSSQARRKAGKTLLEGVHLCQAYLEQGYVPAACIVGEGALAHPEVEALLQTLDQQVGQGVLLPDPLFRGLSQVEQGVAILFLIDTPTPALPPALLEDAVLLDRLQDPGNLGSLLRSAAAAGVRQVLCSPGTVFAWSPKVLRAGMGAHFQLQIHEQVDLENVLRQARIPIIATSPHSQHSLYQLDLTGPVAWLLGHEGQGVEAQLLAHAQFQARIPHLGKMESLNVAACGAICFFEQVRQKVAAEAR